MFPPGRSLSLCHPALAHTNQWNAPLSSTGKRTIPNDTSPILQPDNGGGRPSLLAKAEPLWYSVGSRRTIPVTLPVRPRTSGHPVTDSLGSSFPRYSFPFVDLQRMFDVTYVKSKL